MATAVTRMVLEDAMIRWSRPEPWSPRSTSVYIVEMTTEDLALAGLGRSPTGG